MENYGKQLKKEAESMASKVEKGADINRLVRPNEQHLAELMATVDQEKLEDFYLKVFGMKINFESENTLPARDTLDRHKKIIIPPQLDDKRVEAVAVEYIKNKYDVALMEDELMEEIKSRMQNSRETVIWLLEQWLLDEENLKDKETKSEADTENVVEIVSTKEDEQDVA